MPIASIARFRLWALGRYQILCKKLQPNTISQLVIPGHGGKRLRDVGVDVSRGGQHSTIWCVSFENAPVPAQACQANWWHIRGSSHPLSTNVRPRATTCDRPRVGGRYRIPHPLYNTRYAYEMHWLNKLDLEACRLRRRPLGRMSSLVPPIITMTIDND